MTPLRAIAWALLSLPLVTMACGGSDTPAAGAAGAGAGGAAGSKPCNEAPFSTCPAGKTCWVTDKAGSGFSCFNSQPGAGKGAKCDNVVATPSCDDGLMCFSTNQLTGVGTCVTFCDATHPCDVSEKCTGIAFSAALKPFVFACIPTGTGGTGGGSGVGGSAGVAGSALSGAGGT